MPGEIIVGLHQKVGLHTRLIRVLPLVCGGIDPFAPGVFCPCASYSRLITSYKRHYGGWDEGRESGLREADQEEDKIAKESCEAGCEKGVQSLGGFDRLVYRPWKLSASIFFSLQSALILKSTGRLWTSPNVCV